MAHSRGQLKPADIRTAHALTLGATPPPEEIDLSGDPAPDGDDPALMPQFKPAAPKPPKSKIQVPYRQREQVQPKEIDKAPKQEHLLWARRLPYKLVQGSHIGHGIRMEPSRKVPFAGQYA